MKRKRTIAIALLAAGILVAAWFIIRTPAPKEISGNPSIQKLSSGEQAPRTHLISMRQMVSEATADRRHISIPRRSEDALRSALSTDKALATFKLLSDKALRTSEEEHQYSGLISDRARLLVAKDDLLSMDPSQESEMKRIVQVKFLADSYFWKDNPERALAHQMMMEVLLHEFPAETSKDVLKSLYGDKIELYQYLLMGEPSEAEKILTMAYGTQMEKVFRAAAGMIGHQMPSGE